MLKEQCYEISSRISFPWAPDILNGSISNFFEHSQQLNSSSTRREEGRFWPFVLPFQFRFLLVFYMTNLLKLLPVYVKVFSKIPDDTKQVPGLRHFKVLE